MRTRERRTSLAGRVGLLETVYRPLSPLEKWIAVTGPSWLQTWLSDRMPDFMLVGAPQSGTTWLHEALVLHPAIEVPKKEIGYWDKKFDRQPLPYYLHRFQVEGRESGTIVGDMSTNYGRIVPSRIECIAALSPNLRLLFIGRDPVERTWASFRRSGALEPSALDDEELVLELVQRHLAKSTLRRDMPGVIGGLAHSDYSAQLINWLSFFSRDQLHFCSYEQLFRNPSDELRKIQLALGVPEVELSVPRDRVNRNPSAPMPGAVRGWLSQRFAGETARTALVLGVDGSDWGWSV